MELAPGVKLGPYEILGPLGAGGMGQVWKARDTRLDREVAIKIIAHDKSEDATLQSRFEREARALSALNHPNIVAVYDVGEHEGGRYIVSELVRGESLRQVLSRGPLPADRLIPLATQIANALAAAHSAGIVHRDLKPENIMITGEGNVKILDFGLARRTRLQSRPSESTVTQTTATQPGMVMGTAGYMSPEQICGEEIDGRSDIFSMGVVLYEMASGARAFHGRSSIEMMSAVLKDDPTKLHTRVSGVLDRIIWRCLQKDPAKRFQNAAELNSALEALGGRAQRSGVRLSWVAGAAAVIAIAAGGYLQFGRKPAVAPSPAAKAAVVPQAAVPPPAPPAMTAAPEVTTPKPAPSKPHAEKKAAVSPANDASYEQAYERGMVLLSQRRWQQAADELSEAIRLKPDSGMAYLGRCRVGMARQDYPPAIADCSEAARLVPNSPEAYHERGNAYLLTLQFDHAVEDMNAAIKLGDSDLALAHSIRGRAHIGLKEFGAAIADLDEAIRLNPQMPHFYVFRGIALNARSEFRKAIADFDEALRLQPNLPMAYTQRANAKQRLGDKAGAAADRLAAAGVRKAAKQP